MSHPQSIRSSHLFWLTLFLFLAVGSLAATIRSAAQLKTSEHTDTPNSLLDPAAAESIRRLSLPTKDLIVDPNTQTIYATVPGTAGASGNSLTRIDPIAGTIGTSVFVGSDPGKLAISDNRQFIYASLDGEGAVRRFDIATQTAQLHFSLGNSRDGAMFVEDMEVLPGAPESLAISRMVTERSPHHEAVVVYDNDVRRPTISNINVAEVNFIEFSSSASLLYGFDDSGPLFRLSVTDSGVSFINQVTGLMNEAGDIEFDGGLLYHTGGRVINPEAGTIAGTYSGMNFFPFFIAHSVVVDSANNRVFFLTGGHFDPGTNGTARVYAFNKTTFEMVDFFSIAGTKGNIGSLVQWGSTGLAFRDEDSVYLIPTPGSGPAPPPPSPTPTPTPTPTPAPGELRQVELSTNDLLVGTGSTPTIYASVPGSAGPIGNTITLLDPVSGNIGSSVPIGNDPNKLALSQNGQHIYVGLDGENAVRRFEVATNSAGLQFPITEKAMDIAPMPENPDTIAVVSNRSSPKVVIYDNGAPRLLEKLDRVTSIEFSNSPEVLYGYDAHTSSFNFSKMVVASCGVALGKATSQLISGNTNYIKYDNGRVYSAGGRVIDPDAATLLGTFFVPSGGFPLVETDSKAKRIYSLHTTFFGSTTTLRVFDMETFVQIGALSLPGVTGVPINLVRWGSNGLAFNTPTQVFLLQNALISGPSPPFTPAPTASPSTFTVSGTVTDLVTAITPVSDVTITFSGLRSGTTQTGADGKFAIGNLPLCGTLTITPSKPNHTFTPSSITLTNPAHQTANFSAFHRTIGFAQQSVTVSEGSSRVFLTVQRFSGLPPVTTDIIYSTSNGTASDRSDFTSAFGILHLDTVTGQASIEVLLTNDVFVEGPETFTATVEPVPGFDLVNPTITVTITDNDTSPPTSNPVDTTTFFVRQHYHDFLNRDPDLGGLQFWSNEIESCGTDKQCREIKRINVSAAFFLSIEFQETGFLAFRMYKTAYGDTTSPNVSIPVPIIRLREFLTDAPRLGRNVRVGIGDWQAQLEVNKTAYAREFVVTPRFLTAYPLTMTPAQFVAKLDQNAGNVLSASERDQLIAELAAAPDITQGRASVTRKVAEDADLRQRETNRAFVLMQYYGYLRRNPDDPQDTDFRGWEFWLNKLNQFDGNFINAEMVKSFLVSIEYRERFGP